MQTSGGGRRSCEHSAISSSRVSTGAVLGQRQVLRSRQCRKLSSFTGADLARGFCVPVVVQRQEFWSRHCRKQCFGPDSADKCLEVLRCIAEQIVVYQHHKSLRIVEVIQFVGVTVEQIEASSATDHGENVEVIQLYT